MDGFITAVRQSIGRDLYLDIGSDLDSNKGLFPKNFFDHGEEYFAQTFPTSNLKKLVVELGLDLSDNEMLVVSRRVDPEGIGSVRLDQLMVRTFPERFERLRGKFEKGEVTSSSDELGELRYLPFVEADVDHTDFISLVQFVQVSVGWNPVENEEQTEDEKQKMIKFLVDALGAWVAKDPAKFLEEGSSLEQFELELSEVPELFPALDATSGDPTDPADPTVVGLLRVHVVSLSGDEIASFSFELATYVVEIKKQIRRSRGVPVSVQKLLLDGSIIGNEIVLDTLVKTGQESITMQCIMEKPIGLYYWKVLEENERDD